MNKVWLIIQREYITRVKKKSFLITTFLIPILMLGLTSTMMYLSMKSENKETIAVIDDSGVFTHKLDSTSSTFTFKYVNPLAGESNDSILERNDCNILLHIYPFTNGKPDSIHILKDGGVSLNAKSFIKDELNSVFEIKQMQDAGINKEKIDSIHSASLDIKSFDLKNNQETSSEVATMIGYVMGFLIYIVILIYGMGVMRGVMEEKTNRIAEVIISSVKPFQLMMGKIIGIAFVGLTQFTMWLVLTAILQLFLPLLIPGLTDTMHGPGVAQIQQQMKEVPQNEIASLLITLSHQNWLLILSCFLFYFLGGYFIYASMFAAVGSMVNEDQQEAQQMTLPITTPIILGFIIMASAIKDPNSSLAVFGSMFPLTSPIVMMARIPYGVPAWQILTSMLLLIAGFLFMTWLSAKIYRTGILMYGKKASWKEVFKWIRQS